MKKFEKFGDEFLALETSHWEVCFCCPGWNGILFRDGLSVLLTDSGTPISGCRNRRPVGCTGWDWASLWFVALSPWPLSWAASLSLTPLNGSCFSPMSSPRWVRPGIPDVHRELVTAAAGAPKPLHRQGPVIYGARTWALGTQYYLDVPSMKTRNMGISEPDMQLLAPPCQTKPGPVSPPMSFLHFPECAYWQGWQCRPAHSLGVTVRIQAQICMVPASHQDPRSPCHRCDASALQEAEQGRPSDERIWTHFWVYPSIPSQTLFLLTLDSGSHMGQLVPSESHCHHKTHLQVCDLSLVFYPFFLKSCSFSVENNTLFLFNPL